LSFSYWIDNLGFITERKLAAIFIKPSLGVSNWPVIYFINCTPTSSLAPFITVPSGSKGDLIKSGDPCICNGYFQDSQADKQINYRCYGCFSGGEIRMNRKGRIVCMVENACSKERWWDEFS
jgi:hypothetical protein